MRKSKVIIRGLAVSLFVLLASAGYAQQDTADHGAQDILYIDCTSPDFFDKDSITVIFDLVLWTDAPYPNDAFVAWGNAFYMTSSNASASARVILDESPMGPVYKGTASGYPNDWEARFNGAEPSSGLLPATAVYGAIQDLMPPANAGPSLSAGTHILAHILIRVKDTTTIFIDTNSIETPVCLWLTGNFGCYVPLWIEPASCPVTPLTCLYKPGDANGDGKVDLSDLMFIVNRVYKGGPAPSFECQADLNADKIVTLLDIYLGVKYLFKGGNPPIRSWVCCL